MKPHRTSESSARDHRKLESEMFRGTSCGSAVINTSEDVARRKISWFAIITRIGILLFQLTFNVLCPDHNADAFTSPLDPNESVSVYDKFVTIVFGGLSRWDAQYFIHIARHGYTYENTLAFFPLYPMSVRYVASILRPCLVVLNNHSVIIIAAVLINFLCFVKSSVIFYDLSKKILVDRRTAFKAAVLYCISPASIFFTAAYSEAMFAYLTFHSMLAAVERKKFVCLPIGLSGIVRSNGPVSIGYPVYIWMQDLIRLDIKRNIFMKLLNLIANLLWIFNTVFLSLIPFILVQTYNYILFCTNRNVMGFPSYVIDYGVKNNLVMPGSDKPSWCLNTIPISYSHIQEKYWNVGLFKYYEIKQLPNFCLALPILYIIIRCIVEYFNENKEQFYKFTFIRAKEEKITRFKKYPMQMLPFIIHGAFLTIFCILFVHIQVSTRLLGSASPLLYWFCAISMSHQVKNERNVYECQESIFALLFDVQKKYTKADKLILIYFIGYTIIGSFMHSNFLPWT